MKKHTYEVTADVKSNGVERRCVVDVDADTTEEAIQIARDMRPNAALLNVQGAASGAGRGLVERLLEEVQGLTRRSPPQNGGGRDREE